MCGMQIDHRWQRLMVFAPMSLTARRWFTPWSTPQAHESKWASPL